MPGAFAQHSKQSLSRTFGTAIGGLFKKAFDRFGFVSHDEVSRLFDATFLRRFADTVQRGGSFNAFAGGRMTRSHPEFIPSSIGPNAQAERYGDLLVRRVRDLVDSNPIIDGALLTFQNEVLGTGIVAQPNTGNDRVNRLIEDAWHEFAEGVDVDRSMSIYESQRLALAEYWSGGEGFHHYSVTDAHRGRPSGPCITIIPRERLPLHDSWMSRAVNTESDGSILRQSIRMDRLGRVLSYRVLDADPADNVWVAPNTRDIPSSDIMHMYRRRRAEQLRGLPTPLTAVLVSQDVDALVEASVYLARMVSAMGLIVKSLA